jgi:diguanylate cyclase (GGDEF)-like protein
MAFDRVRSVGALGGVSIRARVAIFATLLALGCLGLLGYVQMSSLSSALTRATQEQSVLGTRQLASSIAGLSPSIVSIIPADTRGLDGLIVFDANGRVLGESGGTRATLRGLKAQARTVARTGRGVFQFRVAQGGTRSRRVDRLAPWSSNQTVLVAMVPREGGVLATSYHVGWATDRLRSTALSSALNLGGAAAFLCFSLLLMLGRLVTRPLGLLAAEVRHLGEGNLDARLSPQRSPELRQLAADTSQMRDDLLQAVRDSSTDPLTGVANHRGFHEHLTAAATAAMRDGTPLALIAIDLDNLKTLNDRFGHQAGDRIIQAVATAIAGTCRPGDLCGRVGGDEFAVVCAGADRAAGEAIAKRIAAEVHKISVAELAGPAARSSGLVASVSTGVSDLPGSARSQDELIVYADAALYAAKGLRPVSAPLVAPPDAPEAPASAPRLEQTVRGISVALGVREGAKSNHCDEVACYAAAIGEELGLSGSELASVRRAALLHDAGNIGVPDAVLLKPGPLTPAEREVMEAHSALGYRIMLAAGLPEREAQWVLHHHEHLDGSGYPHGLRGDEIPLASRILLVADAFEGMTTPRPYHPARSRDAALAELRRCAGTQFDARAVEALARALAQTALTAPATGLPATAEGRAPAWHLTQGVVR